MIINTDDYKYKIELHTHTSPASRCSHLTPEELILAEKEAGVDAVVITNHYWVNDPYFSDEQILSDYRLALEAGKKHGVTVILGIEICFIHEPENHSNDYLVYGIDEDFIKEFDKARPESVPEFCKLFKNEKMVIIHAHPDRDRKQSHVSKDYIDGIEAFNLHHAHNSRVGVTAQYTKENGIDLIVCGTDLHERPNQGLCCIRTKTLPKDSFELAQILKENDFLFDIAGFISIPAHFSK